jgi:hypothetical protein
MHINAATALLAVPVLSIEDKREDILVRVGQVLLLLRTIAAHLRHKPRFHVREQICLLLLQHLGIVAERHQLFTGVDRGGQRALTAPPTVLDGSGHLGHAPLAHLSAVVDCQSDNRTQSTVACQTAIAMLVQLQCDAVCECNRPLMTMRATGTPMLSRWSFCLDWILAWMACRAVFSPTQTHSAQELGVSPSSITAEAPAGDAKSQLTIPHLRQADLA